MVCSVYLETINNVQSLDLQEIESHEYAYHYLMRYRSAECLTAEQLAHSLSPNSFRTGQHQLKQRCY